MVNIKKKFNTSLSVQIFPSLSITRRRKPSLLWVPLIIYLFYYASGWNTKNICVLKEQTYNPKPTSVWINMSQSMALFFKKTLLALFPYETKELVMCKFIKRTQGRCTSNESQTVNNGAGMYWKPGTSSWQGLLSVSALGFWKSFRSSEKDFQPDKHLRAGKGSCFNSDQMWSLMKALWFCSCSGWHKNF